MLIEDDPIDLSLLTRCLRRVKGHFEVQSVGSLADAVLRLREGEFQLIITDLGLPDSSGTDTVRRVGREARGTPILVLSDGEEQLVGLPSVRGGAQDFLPKSSLDVENLGRAIGYGLERRRIELRLEKMAMSDGLTGAHNRAFFDCFIAETPAAGLTILWLDLDRFKQTNDRYGHAVGDALLKGVVARLQARLRVKDLVCRLGGDEFGIILRGVSDQTTAVHLAEEICCLLEQPYVLAEGVTLRQTVSIGVAWFDSESQGESEDLVRAADTAMYAAKAAGRGAVAVHTPAMAEERRKRLELDALLMGALGRGEFSVEYQPIVDLESDEVIALEASAQWFSPSMQRWVEPREFMPRAVELGAIHSIGTFVFNQALTFIAALRRSRPEMVVSVNVSGRQLQRGDFAPQVAQTLRAYGLPGAALSIEVKESEIINHREECIESLHALRELGATVAIRDFGTGYSSLTNLLELPLTTIKLDESLSAKAVEDADAQRLIRGLIAMSQSLGIRVIAAGIENDQQRAYMHAAGFPVGQGQGFAGHWDPADFSLQLVAA